jgi:hypothetical protein
MTACVRCSAVIYRRAWIIAGGQRELSEVFVVRRQRTRRSGRLFPHLDDALRGAQVAPWLR